MVCILTAGRDYPTPSKLAQFNGWPKVASEPILMALGRKRNLTRGHKLCVGPAKWDNHYPRKTKEEAHSNEKEGE